jgi:hypothetical protein
MCLSLNELYSFSLTMEHVPRIYVFSTHEQWSLAAITVENCSVVYFRSLFHYRKITFVITDNTDEKKDALSLSPTVG